ncbi:MAG: glycosyltransferase family 2 protein [Candidatus Paceibacterota bacterium]
MPNSESKINCTVGILTFNSDKVLRRALESVKEFNEIIICDGGSNDETLNIARAYGCKIIFQNPDFKKESGRIKNFGGVRNQMLDASTNDWYLYLDSDEYIGEDLKEEIRDIIENNIPAVYWMSRKYVVSGKIIDCATTYPNRQVRFFNKKSTNRFIKEIHERIETKSDALILNLKNCMYVPMDVTKEEVRKKWNYYIDLECERRGDLSFFQWLWTCLNNSKISLLFFYRLLRNAIFCKGNKMPLWFEMERHIYHLNICKRFFKKITKLF